MTNLINHQSQKIILIVDDTPNILQLLFNYLNNAGYKILIAQNGKKALKVVEVMQPDLIVLDVMMPELDGFGTCRRLKANPNTKDIPIIFMTALSQAEEKVQGLMLGAVDYITKPIDEQELLARIKTHLALQSLNQRLAQDAARQKLLWEISDRIRQSLDLNLILQTATEEIKTFLGCDFVGLARLNEQDISLAAYSATTDMSSESATALLYNYLCPQAKKERYTDCRNCDISKKLCHQFYLQGNIQVIEQQETTTSFKTIASAEPQRILILPILVNNVLTDISQTPLAPVLDDKNSSQSFSSNSLWGWLIVRRSQLTSKWQVEEIDILKKLAIQLAIGIKQGLLYQQLSQLAILDSLTQTYNRRYFDQQLDLEWRRLGRSSLPLSLIMCDIDCFKIYNDTYGHQQGDECLQQVAQAIATVIKRPGDILARYGGEEFVVILPNTPQPGAIKVAESMRVAVKKLNIPHLNSSVDSVVTISLGVASTVPNREDNPHLLTKATDLALYQAKKRGRDCLAVYPDSISHAQDRQKSEIAWVKRLRHALDHNLFSLYAQPIAPLAIGERTKYFEILLRLTDEGNRVIAPHAFLDIAERNFLMSEIDTWVVDRLLETLATMGDRFNRHNYRFSINLSGASLNNESFMEFLTQKLTDYHLPAHLFCFEITETVAISDVTKLVKFIDSLKDIGCSFALDDFGKGMSSLSYLKNLPVDYLKIDGSFIKQLNNEKTSKVMVEAIHHIAEGMGLKTVAEFVENQIILDTVRELKVDYAQGFHLGQPGILMDVII